MLLEDISVWDIRSMLMKAALFNKQRKGESDTYNMQKNSLKLFVTILLLNLILACFRGFILPV